MSYEVKVIFWNQLKSPYYEHCAPKRAETSGRSIFIKNIRENDILKNPNPPTRDSIGEKMKILIPWNIIDFWTRLEVLLGSKLSGHNVGLTEGSNLLEELLMGFERQN